MVPRHPMLNRQARDAANAGRNHLGALSWLLIPIVDSPRSRIRAADRREASHVGAAVPYIPVARPPWLHPSNERASFLAGAF
jgi:hypothetical protein